MRGIFADFTEVIEPLSLDEAYLDVSEVCEEDLTATRIAKMIRKRVEEELAITVSAGVSVNKVYRQGRLRLGKTRWLDRRHPHRSRRVRRGTVRQKNSRCGCGDSR